MRNTKTDCYSSLPSPFTTPHFRFPCLSLPVTHLYLTALFLSLPMLSILPTLRVYTTCDRVTTQFDIDHRVTPRIMSISLIPDPKSATGGVLDGKRFCQ